MKKIKLCLLLVLISISSLAIAANDSANTKYWIIFSDKDGIKQEDVIKYNSFEYKAGIELLTEKAINRRLKVLRKEELIGFADLPVSNKYIDKIMNMKIDVIAKEVANNPKNSEILAILPPSETINIQQNEMLKKLSEDITEFKNNLGKTNSIFLKINS